MANAEYKPFLGQNDWTVCQWSGVAGIKWPLQHWSTWLKVAKRVSSPFRSLSFTTASRLLLLYDTIIMWPNSLMFSNSSSSNEYAKQQIESQVSTTRNICVSVMVSHVSHAVLSCMRVLCSAYSLYVHWHSSPLTHSSKSLQMKSIGLNTSWLKVWIAKSLNENWFSPMSTDGDGGHIHFNMNWTITRTVIAAIYAHCVHYVRRTLVYVFIHFFSVEESWMRTTLIHYKTLYPI